MQLVPLIDALNQKRIPLQTEIFNIIKLNQNMFDQLNINYQNYAYGLVFKFPGSLLDNGIILSSDDEFNYIGVLALLDHNGAEKMLIPDTYHFFSGKQLTQPIWINQQIGLQMTDGSVLYGYKDYGQNATNSLWVIFYQ